MAIAMHICNATLHHTKILLSVTIKESSSGQVRLREHSTLVALEYVLLALQFAIGCGRRIVCPRRASIYLLSAGCDLI